ncbi:Sulfatase family protein [Rubrivivax sp. A210]|uniref:LTA synthase family protein n=1 Tax=Rubrivivax sp. A210 TaxID=2772301 RepID=UPI0019195980|nr:LTA synthase family protein [Rubrivivax sp. A210]CAD5370585.1 Sulfatase family protein [Rubrivivax sp. A210]
MHLPARLSSAFSSVLDRLLRGVGRACTLVPPLLLALGAIRIVQLVHFWPAGFHASAPDVGRVLLQGLRFDLRVGAVAGLLLLPALAWLPARAAARLLAGVVALLLLLSLINLHYFGFYKTPIDDVVFGLFEDDTRAVLQTVWHDFPVLATLALGALLTLVTVRLQRGLLRRLAPSGVQLLAWPPALRALALVLALLALLLANKGTLRAMPLQRQHFSVTPSAFLNDMVPNGAVALNYAWDSRRKSLDLGNPLAGLRGLGFDSPLAAAAVLGLPRGSEAELAAAMSTHEALPAGTPRRNLVFVLMESWSAEPLRYQGPGFDVLGRMAPTLANACHFSNFDSAQGGTHTTLEALLYASPITPLTLGRAGRKPIPWSIALVARQAGYRTLFLTSTRAGWRQLDRVLAVQGFDEVVDGSTLQQAYPEAEMGIWGVWDGYVFRYLAERLARPPAEPGDKPLFVFVLTATNHPPYDLPADYARPPLDLAAWKGETGSETLKPNLDTYRYATDLLGGFVQQVMQGPQKDRTVIAATGDHNVRSFGIYAEPARRHLLHQVPFVIWGAGRPCGEQQQLPASHRDIFPTLMPLAGISGPYLNSGRNLLRPPSAAPLEAPRALFFAGEARSATGLWRLGDPASFSCSPPREPADACRFDAADDLQERARLGLLDWHVRRSLR